MAIEHWRHLWTSTVKYEPGYELLGTARRYTFWWDIIRPDSFVLITAAEASIGAQTPTRFMGLARPIVVGNIAAQDGFVEFCLWWEGNWSGFHIWTDITVFDRNDRWGTN